MTTTSAPKLTLRPYRYGDAATGPIDRYYVSVDDVQVGWVCKNSDGWAFYAPVREAFKGERLAWGNKTRRDALMEGLSELRIHHLGRVITFSADSLRDEARYVPEADLEALWNRLLDEKYPEA